MESYGQYCPVSRAAEILGDRWTLLILRDMVVDDVTHFNDLARGLPRLSRGLLSRRLRELEERGVITREASAPGQRGSYRLNPAGAALRALLDELLEWGAEWAFSEPRPGELDPLLLLWWMHRRLRPDRLPASRTVVELHFEEEPGSAYWLALQRHHSAVCFTPPSVDTDVWIHTSLRRFYQVWLGRLQFEEARAAGWIRVDARPDLDRALPGWFAWSSAAPAVRRHTPPDRLSQDSGPMEVQPAGSPGPCPG